MMWVRGRPQIMTFKIKWMLNFWQSSRLRNLYQFRAGSRCQTLDPIRNSVKYHWWWIAGIRQWFIKPGHDTHRHPATDLKSYFLYLCLNPVICSAKRFLILKLFVSSLRQCVFELSLLQVSVRLWRDVFSFSFFLLLSCLSSGSFFRGGKEQCCWADLVSTNIRELLINHGRSTQWDTVGVTVFVCLGA